MYFVYEFLSTIYLYYRADSRSELDTENSECVKSVTVDYKDKDRQNQILLHFSRAIWKILKQSNAKIKVSTKNK